jgi:ribonuclease HI
VGEEFAVKLGRSTFTSSKAWLFEFLDRSSDQEAVTLAVTCWHLWEHRNAVRNDEKMKHPRSLAEQIKAYIHMILLHLFKKLVVQSRETSTPPRWSPPPEGTVFINVNAALFSSSNRMGVGVVIRDHIGNCLVACNQLLDEVTPPEIAEALAVRCALTLARDEGLNKVILASDCISVVQRINSSARDRSLIGVVVEDIKAMAATMSSVTVHHISRLLNNSAHVLARRVQHFGSPFFRNSVPDCIRFELCNVIG